MSKRYLHSADGSKIVENESTEHREMLESGEWFENKADVECEGKPTQGEAKDPEKEAIVFDIQEVGDEELMATWEMFDVEMQRRGFFKEEENTADGEEKVTIDLDALNDSELKALGQKYKIASFASMKRETLIEALRGLNDA